MTDLTLALLALNMGQSPRTMGEVRDTVADALAQAGDKGAALLALPEYWCEAWLTLAPRGLAETEEIPWMADQADDLLPALADLARESKVALLAGTVPVAVGNDRYRTTGRICSLPDGRVLLQDKLSLTPDERDPSAWNLEPGDRLDVLTWRGLKLAVVVCLDIEQPSLAARLQRARPRPRPRADRYRLRLRSRPGVRLRQGAGGRVDGGGGAGRRGSGRSP